MNDYIFYVLGWNFMKTGLDRLFEHVEELNGKVVTFAVIIRQLISVGIICSICWRNTMCPSVRFSDLNMGWCDCTRHDFCWWAGYEMTIETVSLYGETEDSLHQKKHFKTWMCCCSRWNISTEYYTYQASLGYIMEVATNQYWLGSGSPTQSTVCLFAEILCTRALNLLCRHILSLPNMEWRWEN